MLRARWSRRLPADDARPLEGSRVLLTAQRRADELAGGFERRGAQVLHAPTLSVVPHVDDPQLLARTRELLADPPDDLVVTTGVGFRGWLEAATAAGLDQPLLDLLSRTRIVARGPKAHGALRSAGLPVAWVATSEVSAEIRDELLDQGVAGRRIAIQHHGAGADGLDEAFADAGAVVCPLVVYRWGPPPDEQAVTDGLRRVAAREVDAVLFTSAPGAAAFLERAEGLGLLADVVAAGSDPGGVLFAAVGTTTAGPLVAAGLDPLVPDRFRLGALVRAVVSELASRG